MREIRGDLFAAMHADAICILTNGVAAALTNAAVMGRGCARQAKDRWPGIELVLGQRILKQGNTVQVLTQEVRPPSVGCFIAAPHDVVHAVPYHILSFPTKHNWRDPASTGLIWDSLRQLVTITTVRGWDTVVLPRPGCGLGGLKWEQDVRPLCAELLDDRFYVITF